jgi:pimeloyl-ACP methyl ester carboxylesterase
MIYNEFLDNGKNKLIVMIHGFTQNHKVFSRQVEFFKDKYNILLLDLRGHGKSDEVKGPFGIEEYTDDVEEIFVSRKIKNAILWGTHTGTGIGLNLYFRNKEYLSALILEGVVIPGYDTPEINKNIQRSKRVTLENGLESGLYDWLKNSGWFSYMNENMLATRYSEYKKINDEFTGHPFTTALVPRKADNVYSKLSSIDIPMLVYNGEYDMEEFFSMAKALEKNQKTKRVVVSKAGGFPCWENPSEVNKTVEKFLELL